MSRLPSHTWGCYCNQTQPWYDYRMRCGQALSSANMVRSCHLLRYFRQSNCAVEGERLHESTFLANICNFITQHLRDIILLGSMTIPSQGPTQIQRPGPFDAPQSLPQSLPAFYYLYARLIAGTLLGLHIRTTQSCTQIP